MVTFVPPYLGEYIKSNAEKKMYNALQNISLKNCYILHSLGLPKHQSKIYGEIDFVLICERGIVCLEVKGGRIECQEGKWIFTDFYGIQHIKAEGPFTQVIGNMFSLREVLKKKFATNPHMKNILMASGVVFPDIKFTKNTEEIIPEIIYDSSTENINNYINQVFDYWQARQYKEPSKLSPNDIKSIVDYLRGEFVFIPLLSNRLNDIDNNLIKLTNEQVQIVNALSDNLHLLIEGNAGTGKTLIAVNFANKCALEGKKVLYLTFNKNLSNYINKKINDKNITVINIHALFGLYVNIDINKLKCNPTLYFSEILPEQFFNFVTELSDDELEKMKYDVLIMDEGQDIIKPSYLYSLDSILHGGLRYGKWAIFYDEKQNIYNSEYDDGFELLKSYDSTKFKLFINCRNTVQIGTYSSKVSGVKINEFIRENGEEVQKIKYSDLTDYKSKIKEILKKLRIEKIEQKDILFLSPKKYENSTLAMCGISVNDINEDFDEKVDLPIYSTIHGYKGLDSKIVILIDLDYIRDENFSKFLYIAGTRARTLLYIIGSENFWENHDA